MDRSDFPVGWDEKRVRQVLDHHEPQNEDEQDVVIEAAHHAEGMTLMSVPPELVPEVRVLLARARRA